MIMIIMIDDLMDSKQTRLSHINHEIMLFNPTLHNYVDIE